MRERTTTVYTCELCGFSSEDRERVAKCEAQGVVDAPPADRVGFIRCVEQDHLIGEVIRHEWLVQVRVVESSVVGHSRHCRVEVVPWSADEDAYTHRNMIVDGDDTFPLDDIMFDPEEAERALFS